MISIEAVLKQEDIMRHWQFIRKLPELSDTRLTMLSNALLGNLIVLSFQEDDTPIGVSLILPKGKIAVIFGLVLEGRTKDFYNMYFNKLKEFGFTSAEAISNHDEDYFKGFSKFKKVWTRYKKEL